MTTYLISSAISGAWLGHYEAIDEVGAFDALFADANFQNDPADSLDIDEAVGALAIRYFNENSSAMEGFELCKHADPTEGPRTGLNVYEAEDIAEVNDALIYLAPTSSRHSCPHGPDYAGCCRVERKRIVAELLKEADKAEQEAVAYAGIPHDRLKPLAALKGTKMSEHLEGVETMSPSEKLAFVQGMRRGVWEREREILLQLRAQAEEYAAWRDDAGQHSRWENACKYNWKRAALTEMTNTIQGKEKEAS